MLLRVWLPAAIDTPKALVGDGGFLTPVNTGKPARGAA